MKAEGNKIELEGMEKQWMKKALEVLRESLRRSRQKEMAGSEIDTLRGKEIAQLDLMIGKL